MGLCSSMVSVQRTMPLVTGDLSGERGIRLENAIESRTARFLNSSFFLMFALLFSVECVASQW